MWFLGHDWLRIIVKPVTCLFRKFFTVHFFYQTNVVNNYPTLIKMCLGFLITLILTIQSFTQMLNIYNINIKQDII